MQPLTQRRLVVIASIALLHWTGAHAGVPEGLDALRRNDFAAAAKELRPAAERGDPEAQYRIGLMYEFGTGYAKDMQQAIAWVRKAANQGHVAAQVELGVLYTTGDGVPKDDAQSVAWFRKAADQGSPNAQYNLGLMYAKGAGVKIDNAQAIAWFRKSADQGFALAQFKMGVAYDNGEGVPRDPVLAYASYAIAARANNEYASYRDDVAKSLTPAQLREAQSLATNWQPGQPMPTRATAQASATTSTSAAAPRNPAATAGTAADQCSASGSLEGEKFSATHCAVALYTDQHSVTLWFNEDAIEAAEAKSFQSSAYADAAKGGKQRTLVQVMLCPGGGSAVASPAAVKTIDFNSNHAKSPLAGVQWSLKATADFRVEKMAGDAQPGGRLTGRIVGAHGKTSFTLDFAVTLPSTEAAAGMTCGK
jgi:TPR repeat protein